ncbi:helix-turn-helix domain-containing protein [Chitinophaga sp. 22620]|uniref:helix-turn-helix domain-containing protein n=1 Tax=Chitinophaga sp. 22620 TaxID=3453952 RepID=UPI003F857862
MLNNPMPAKFHIRFLQNDGPAEGNRTITEIPPQYRPYLHPFATAAIEESPGVDVLHQTLQANGYLVSNHVFFAKEDAEITPHVPESIYTLHCMMKGSIRCELAGQGTVWLRGGQFGFFRITNDRHRAWLEKGSVCESFHIDLSSEHLQRLAPHSEVIRLLLVHAESNRAAYISPASGIMHQRFYELIQEIRDMPLAHRLKDIAIPAHITLLLTSALMEEENAGLNDDDMLLFATIRAYALNNLDKELGNRELAADYCISVSKLKYGFKRIYDESLQSFVKRSRLERAKELISSTALPLQRIAQMVGYADYGNFSRRYHAYFGHPPSELKRQ